MESWILIILVIIPAVWSGTWGVTLKDQCAVIGATVVINCTYDYPSTPHQNVSKVEWKKYLDISKEWENQPELSGRFQYVGNYQHNCNLKINDVQDSDGASYRFRFETTVDKWSSREFARLSVTGLTTVVKPTTVTEGESVTLNCSLKCQTDIVWFKDEQPVLKTTFQATKDDAGGYYCAIPGQERVRSVPVDLNVLYAPTNTSVLVDSLQAVEGGSVNLTCSSVANPEANYIWFMKRDSPSSVHLVSSGQVLSLPSVEASHAGSYFCQAQNSVGENNSTAVLLTVMGETSESLILPVLAGVGVFIVATLVTALLFWLKQRTNEERKPTVSDSRLNRQGSSSSANESNNIYANVNMSSSVPQPDIPLYSVPMTAESDVTYSTVTIKPRNPNPPRDENSGTAPQDSGSNAAESDNNVIYSSVVKSKKY